MRNATEEPFNLSDMAGLVDVIFDITDEFRCRFIGVNYLAIVKSLSLADIFLE